LYNVGEIEYRIQYFSNVGGLLGLCIGLSIVTIVEILWLCLRLIGKAFDVTARISTAMIYTKDFVISYTQSKNDVKILK